MGDFNTRVVGRTTGATTVTTAHHRLSRLPSQKTKLVVPTVTYGREGHTKPTAAASAWNAELS